MKNEGCIVALIQSSVFHIDEVEGIEPLSAEELNTDASQSFDPDAEAENIIHAYEEREKLHIVYTGNEAFYSPSIDSIHLPERFKFGKKSAEFYSTAFHEITHSTGAHHRLARLTPAHFGSSEYSKEELVAEIGAAGILSLLGIETPESFQNTAAYIHSWLKVLRNDKKLIVSASSKAEKAIHYIINGKESEAA